MSEIKKIKMLYVEDSAVEIRAFQYFVQMEQLPYEFLTAESLEKSEELLKENKFDIVISDYVLKDGTAFELLKLVKDTPIIIVTGLGDEEIAVQALKNGASDYIIKTKSGGHLKTLPVTVEQVLLKKQNEIELEKYRKQLEDLVESKTTELRSEIRMRKETEAKLIITLHEHERVINELRQFVHVASHDLQEPLRLVASFTQLLAQKYQDKMDEDANEYIQFAVDGAKRIKTIIHDFVSYSQVGLSGMFLQLVDLNRIYQKIMRDFDSKIIQMNAKIQTNKLPSVIADGDRIGQVIYHLIDNSLKFAHPDRFPEIGIQAQFNNNQWKFSIQDNGIGIDPIFHERIFYIFEKLHSLKEYRGTGVGLAVCKKIIDAHGGKIWVSSEPEQGSTFHFTLPVRQEEETRD